MEWQRTKGAVVFDSPRRPFTSGRRVAVTRASVSPSMVFITPEVYRDSGTIRHCFPEISSLSSAQLFAPPQRIGFLEFSVYIRLEENNSFSAIRFGYEVTQKQDQRNIQWTADIVHKIQVQPQLPSYNAISRATNHVRGLTAAANHYESTDFFPFKIGRPGRRCLKDPDDLFVIEMHVEWEMTRYPAFDRPLVGCEQVIIGFDDGQKLFLDEEQLSFHSIDVRRLGETEKAVSGREVSMTLEAVSGQEVSTTLEAVSGRQVSTTLCTAETFRDFLQVLFYDRKMDKCDGVHLMAVLNVARQLSCKVVCSRIERELLWTGEYSIYASLAIGEEHRMVMLRMAAQKHVNENLVDSFVSDSRMREECVVQSCSLINRSAAQHQFLSAVLEQRLECSIVEAENELEMEYVYPSMSSRIPSFLHSMPFPGICITAALSQFVVPLVIKLTL